MDKLKRRTGTAGSGYLDGDEAARMYQYFLIISVSVTGLNRN